MLNFKNHSPDDENDDWEEELDFYDFMDEDWQKWAVIRSFLVYSSYFVLISANGLINNYRSYNLQRRNYV